MDKIQYSNLLHIKEASKQGRLVVFAGAGVSNNSGVPVWSSLIDAMKQECNLAYENDDLKIAQLYKDARGEKEYMDKVKEVLKHNKVAPNVIHESILKLKPCHIITTNYDNLFEQEIVKEFKQFDVIREDRDMPNMSYPNSLIKMHGDFDKNNIVLTEEDYYNYEKNFPLIRSFVLSLFASKLVVFIGFSFSDLNLKMILNDLHSVLHDSMQRVYLISDTKPSQTLNTYYEKKGINVVYLSDEDIKELLPTGGEKKRSSLTNPKGVYLHKVLDCILSAKEDKEHDFVSTLYFQLSQIKDQIKTVGNSLRYFIPSSEVKMYNPHSHGLQLGSPYFKALAKQLKTFAGRRKFVVEHKNINRNELKEIAYNNYLFEIDGVHIVDKNKQYELELSVGNFSASWYYYQLDQESLHKRLAYLSMRDVSGNASDLEYPFILQKLGNYMDAYQEYNKLLPLAWERQKYIIYFICLFNILAIRGYIYFHLLLQDEEIAKDFNEKMDEIDLDEILGRLPISENIRYTLRDLLTYRMLGDSTVDTDDKAEQIYQQRKLGEKGGSSQNPNIASLLSKFEREFLFCNNNYIITDNNRYYKAICENTIKGMLNSYATPDKRPDGTEQHQSKITKLFPFCIFVLIFCIESKKLRDYFKHYEIDSIELSEEAIECINKYWKNLYDNKCVVFTDMSKLDNIIQNLIYVTAKIKNDGVNSSMIYTVVLKYWSIITSFEIEENLLQVLLSRYSPEKDQIKKMLDIILNNEDKYDHFNGCLYKFVHYLSVQNEAYELCMAKFKDGRYARQLYPLYKILTPSLKEDFSRYCQENLSDTRDYLEFIVNNKLEVQSVERFNSLVNQINSNPKWYNNICCFVLYMMRMNEKNKNVHDIIDDFAKNSDCLQFYMNPHSFKGTIDAEWILNTGQERAKELSQIPSCKEALRQYLVNDRYINYKKRNYIVSLL